MKPAPTAGKITAAEISKLIIFHYVYGLFYSPEYCGKGRRLNTIRYIRESRFWQVGPKSFIIYQRVEKSAFNVTLREVKGLSLNSSRFFTEFTLSLLSLPKDEGFRMTNEA